MAASLNSNFSISGSCETIINPKANGSFSSPPSIGTLKSLDSRSKEIMGKPLDFSDRKGLSTLKAKAPLCFSVKAQGSICVSRAMRWWEKTLKPNMIEIHSAQELVDSLLNAGDRLVVVDFYSPGCGGCKALHPKICQLAESNPDAVFLKVNYEELKPMCHSLNIHVLPFFRFYRGSQGRLCSFSCTNATIMKFKDALAKYGTDWCSLGPGKGLDGSELMALASTGQISRDFALDSIRKIEMDAVVNQSIVRTSNFGKIETNMGLKEGNGVLVA